MPRSRIGRGEEPEAAGDDAVNAESSGLCAAEFTFQGVPEGKYPCGPIPGATYRFRSKSLAAAEAQAHALGESVHAINAAIIAIRKLNKPALVEPVADALTGIALAIASGHVEDLSAPPAPSTPGGPAYWMRHRTGRLKKASDAAHEFVHQTSKLLAAIGEVTNLTNDKLLARHFADKLAYWLEHVGIKYGFVGPPAEGATADELVRKVQRAAARKGANARTLAKAVLRGWGLTKDEADNILRHAHL